MIILWIASVIERQIRDLSKMSSALAHRESCPTRVRRRTVSQMLRASTILEMMYKFVFTTSEATEQLMEVRALPAGSPLERSFAFEVLAPAPSTR